jgi:hypothetical protein
VSKTIMGMRVVFCVDSPFSSLVVASLHFSSFPAAPSKVRDLVSLLACVVAAALSLDRSPGGALRGVQDVQGQGERLAGEPLGRLQRAGGSVARADHGRRQRCLCVNSQYPHVVVVAVMSLVARFESFRGLSLERRPHLTSFVQCKCRDADAHRHVDQHDSGGLHHPLAHLW